MLLNRNFGEEDSALLCSTLTFPTMAVHDLIGADAWTFMSAMVSGRGMRREVHEDFRFFRWIKHLLVGGPKVCIKKMCRFS